MKQNFGDIEVAKDGSDRVLVSSAIRYYFWFGFKVVHRVYSFKILAHCSTFELDNYFFTFPLSPKLELPRTISWDVPDPHNFGF